MSHNGSLLEDRSEAFRECRCRRADELKTAVSAAAAGKQVRHNQVNRLDLFEHFDLGRGSLADSSIGGAMLMVAFITNRTPHNGLCSKHSLFCYVLPYAGTLFGPLAVFRVELILAVLILLVSLPKLIESFILKTPQSLALIGLAFAAFLSVLFGEHWAGGAIQAFLDFIPNAFAFFLVCLHCNSKRKLQVLVLMLLFVCLFVIAHGYIDLLHGVPESAHVQPG